MKIHDTFDQLREQADFRSDIDYVKVPITTTDSSLESELQKQGYKTEYVHATWDTSIEDMDPVTKERFIVVPIYEHISEATFLRSIGG
jgi:hypothetical protein